MFGLNVTYTKLPEVVAEHAETHSKWVKKYIDNGIFLCAGPKKSKLGGFILAQCNDKSILMKILAEDSYIVADVAEYQIIDFDCKIASAGLEKLVTPNC